MKLYLVINRSLRHNFAIYQHLNPYITTQLIQLREMTEMTGKILDIKKFTLFKSLSLF